MGVVLAPLGLTGDADVIVQWWVPPMAKERVSGGKSKMTSDLFGKWIPFEDLSLQEAADCVMPPAAVPRASILLGPIDLEDDGKLRFQTLDELADAGIDVTSLIWTRTELGNAYRQYRLYAH